MTAAFQEWVPLSGYRQEAFMTLVLMIGAAVCLLYYAGIVIFSGITTSFAWIWLVLAFALGGGALFRRYCCMMPGRAPLWAVVSAITLCCAFAIIFIVVEVLIFSGVAAAPEKNLDYVIVLGAKVRRDGISKTLKMRLDKAIEYSEANPDTMIVVSGGKGPDEPAAEAEAMKAYLVFNGVPKEQILVETRSFSTVENIAYSKVLIEEDWKTWKMTKREPGDQEGREASIGVVTSDFHIFRAKEIGKKWGFPNMKGIPASSDLFMMPHYCVRECAAVLKDKLMGNM